ncbi:hypothetical protein [Dactylosporangium sp. CA-139066]|uniref:hypothetical protein n=1 Tax=Dactylosporangium sp. CA-139066 TaxID=3239930 RepID=UPI003D8B2C68
MQEQRPTETTPGTAIPMPPATPQAPGQPAPQPATQATTPPPAPAPAPTAPQAAPPGTQPTQEASPEPAAASSESTCIWDPGQAEQLRQRWHEMQTRFVEDPTATVAEARQLLDEAVQSLADNVHEREEQLARAGARGSDSTEGKRDAVQQYHRLLDRLLAV